MSFKPFLTCPFASLSFSNASSGSFISNLSPASIFNKYCCKCVSHGIMYFPCYFVSLFDYGHFLKLGSFLQLDIGVFKLFSLTFSANIVSRSFSFCRISYLTRYNMAYTAIYSIVRFFFFQSPLKFITGMLLNIYKIIYIRSNYIIHLVVILNILAGHNVFYPIGMTYVPFYRFIYSLLKRIYRLPA